MILEQDTSNCAQIPSRGSTLALTFLLKPTVSQRRIIITNNRVENEKKLNKSRWLGVVAKLNPFDWFSEKRRGPATPLSVGGCNTVLNVLVDA